MQTKKRWHLNWRVCLACKTEWGRNVNNMINCCWLSVDWFFLKKTAVACSLYSERERERERRAYILAWCRLLSCCTLIIYSSSHVVAVGFLRILVDPRTHGLCRFGTCPFHARCANTLTYWLITISTQILQVKKGPMNYWLIIIWSQTYVCVFTHVLVCKLGVVQIQSLNFRPCHIKKNHDIYKY